ncbi:DNA primase [Flavobacterium sp. LB2P84]|uniref:DNA primase n=1 Tax=Flavobacterium yafengii TaxID=3041253 RepID=UPI0024A9BC3F|nr:DNA primase [Flavobacterium yafengii]MDI6034394.1 DNA primase [Flavobacterium yafengii]
MKRVIVDYAKLTNEILNLLVDKFPDGYDDSNIISFRNAKNELVEAVEVRTEDTIYLVKVSTKLADRIENYDEDDEIIIDDVVEPIKGLDLDDDIDDDDDDDTIDKPDSDSGDDDDDEDSDEKDFSDEDDDDEDDDDEDED